MSTPNTGGTGGTPNGGANAAGGGPQGSAGGAGGNAGAGGGGGTGASGAVDWLNGLSDDARGFIQNKGFKGPSDLLDSYRGLEKLRGVPQERLLALPEKADDADAMGKIYDRLGRPAKPEEYKLPEPKGAKADEKFMEWAKGTFHKLGLSSQQAANLTAEWNNFSESMMSGQTQAFQAELAKQEGQLKVEWGVDHDRNVAIAKKAAATFGISGEMIDQLESVMGFAGVMKHLHGIGSKLGEADFVDGGNGGGKNFGGMSANGAQARIKELTQDKGFMAKLMAQDTAAKDEWNKLHAAAYPGTIAL